MIAYNHYINFIPELKNDKKIEGSFSNIITVEENDSFNLNKKLLYGLDYVNNQGRDLKFYTDREFARTQKGQLWAFEVKDVVTFFWFSGTLNLQYIKDKYFTEELLEYWCLHIVLPMFFTIEETYVFIHAASVEVNDRPILFIAESFGGKSTMTDFFLKQGNTMISDDKVAIDERDGQFFAVPSHPHHRPYRKMEDLGFFVKNFASKSRSIHVLYKLEKVNKNDAIIMVEMHGVEKFRLLRNASEMNLPFQKQERFEFLIKMAESIKIYKITIPQDLNRLKEVFNIIKEHKKLF